MAIPLRIPSFLLFLLLVVVTEFVVMAYSSGLLAVLLFVGCSGAAYWFPGQAALLMGLPPATRRVEVAHGLFGICLAVAFTLSAFGYFFLGWP